MKPYLTALPILLLPLLLTAQYGVSGYINAHQLDSARRTVSLYKVQLNADSNAFSSQQIATTVVGEDGYFTFAGTLFTPEDGIYKIQLNQENVALENSQYRLFIHSNTDSLYFDRSNIAFTAYLSSNLADWEWRKLQNMSPSANFTKLGQELQLRGYVRDSLQILLVKLIGLKQLHDKHLLAKEIEAHPAYYASLIEKLDASELLPDEYAFLSTNYVLVAYQQTAQKYRRSLLLNGLVGLLLLGVLGYVFRLKRQLNFTADRPQLSKQEQLVQELILAGKSNKEIATELYVSIHTVKSHITNLYGKLGVGSRKEMMQKQTGLEPFSTSLFK